MTGHATIGQNKPYFLTETELGDLVKDDDASAAAATFYHSLSTGQTVTEALALTYQTLLNFQGKQAITKDLGSRSYDRQWHLLRFYVADALPGALVTKPKTRGRKRAPRPSVVPQFIDAKQKLRLLPRSEFVGRRRQLQNCLRILKTDWDKLRHEEQRQRLRNSSEDLKYRLRDLFEDVDEVGEKPFLLVFDDNFFCRCWVEVTKPNLLYRFMV